MNRTAVNEVVYKTEFESTVFTNRVFQFFGAAAKNMEIKCKRRDLPFTGGRFILLMVYTVSYQIMDWVKGSIRLRHDDTGPLSK